MQSRHSGLELCIKYGFPLQQSCSDNVCPKMNSKLNGGCFKRRSRLNDQFSQLAHTTIPVFSCSVTLGIILILTQTCLVLVFSIIINTTVTHETSFTFLHFYITALSIKCLVSCDLECNFISLHQTFSAQTPLIKHLIKYLAWFQSSEPRPRSGVSIICQSHAFLFKLQPLFH